MIHNNKEGKNDKEQNILTSVCKPFIQMDTCPFVRQQILINYLNSIYLHTRTHTHKSTSHKQLRQNRTIIYLLKTALDIHDKAKLFIKKEISHLTVIFTRVEHGIGSSLVFLDMKCHTIYNSCYSSTEIISKEYEKST